MKREEYNACVASGLRGKKFSKEERELEFCVMAKTCSGKVKTRDEALEVCRLPKAPKATKAPSTQSTPRASIQELPTQPSAPATMKPSAVDPAHCEVTIFTEVAKMYKDLYAYIYPEHDECGHCDTLRAKILEADIPHPIVDIPGDVCSELAESFGIDRYPSIVKLKRGKVKAVHTGDPNKVIQKMMEGK